MRDDFYLFEDTSVREPLQHFCAVTLTLSLSRLVTPIATITLLQPLEKPLFPCLETTEHLSAQCKESSTHEAANYGTFQP